MIKKDKHMETINYYNLSETELLTAWHKHWDFHEDSYLENNSQGCVDASVQIDKINEVLMAKYRYSSEDIRDMYYR